ncbi:amylo-alpha-1,6-glucosidase [Neobacillus dielmonensis]|uniref:amylo-alpha-1,6-glucosidase n=1 Tax=Neobacillus dielmonensis TaxID=1347369 RepID=UPI0005A9FD6B|nr:trehalase family glycosidase [Neobacillus dielmonensis]
MNIIDVPFSVYGSYMAIAYYNGDESYLKVFKNVQGEGLYLKSVRGKSRGNSAVCKFVPLVEQKPVDYTYEADYGKIELTTASGKIGITFDGDSRIVIKGTGEKLGLRLDCMPINEYDYNFTLENEIESFHIINSYKTLTKYIVKNVTGTTKLVQENSETMLGSLASYIDVNADESSEFLIVIEEIPTHMMKPTKKNYSFEESAAKTLNDFEEFYAKFPKVRPEYDETNRLAVYVTWSCTVRKEGLLGRDSVYMSNNHFPGIWSWDHCYNAIGLAGVHDQLAYDQMMILFDHQDEKGQLPGSVSDSTLRWNFAKPPIHGLFVEKMMEKMEFTPEQLIEVYEGIEKQINFWLNYKDCDEDGICEYHHGNDSGYDNSTVFANGFIVESPDLSAFLIKAMDLLANVAGKLGRVHEQVQWNRRAAELTERALAAFVENNQVIARETLGKKAIYSESILPYTLLILGSRLPEELRSSMIATLKSPKFTTEYGLATEAVDSPFYEPNGYWRGPIWAPTMVLLIEALEDCGETDFALELTEKFCKLIKKSGCAENFDAITGDGLCDKAHTWTSSSFIYLCEKLA